MPFGFTDERPRKTLCGMSLTLGMMLFTMLAGIEGVWRLIDGYPLYSIPSFTFMLTGILALLSLSKKNRTVTFWTWTVLYVLGLLLFMLFLVFSGDILAKAGIQTTAWLMFLLIGLPLSYFVLGIAYFFKEEGKSANDDKFYYKVDG